MKLSEFDYNLPKELIAQEPCKPRDHSRLLVYDRKQDKMTHEKFFNLPKYLTKNDVLVFNNTKVFPARLLGQKETGGKAEALLLEEKGDGKWEALLGTKRPKIGLKLVFKLGLEAEVMEDLPDKSWLIQFNIRGPKFYTILDKIGQVPLPPYIESKETQSKLKTKYQTVFAKETGSAAAPTAGLHFTNRLLKKIKERGVQFEYVTLHVGLGTFEPVNTENIEDFKIHHELVNVDKQTVKRLLKAKKDGKRIIAVGTTSVRTLEAVFQEKLAEPAQVSKYVNIFIYPGYKYKFVDAMITNFHLPKSSLLMLVSALIGKEEVFKIYKKAISLKYKFFSFGDGMFLK
jgi:S-adenosylmethionine:tRNA ribosyltransferase-isomerase